MKAAHGTAGELDRMRGGSRAVRRLRSARTQVYVTSVVAVLTACGREEVPSPVTELAATIADSSGVTVLTLSHTLAEVAAGETSFELIQPDLLVGETGDEHNVWFGALADVASQGGGGFAVLDHLQAQVLVIDSAGRLVSTLGREGDGPGEFREPWSLAAVGGALVVRQHDQARAFTVFREGQLEAVAGAEPEGDWYAARFRWPRVRISGFTTGPEDVTRRLQRFDSTSFIHMLQENELEELNFVDPIEFHDGIPTVLIRYGLDGQVIDTVANLSGPPTFVREVSAQSIFYVQPLFSARPVWTTGRGWYATGHGDSTEVVVRGTGGDVLLRIRTPPRRSPVSEADRIEAADWNTASTILTSMGARERMRSRGPSGPRRAREGTLSRILLFNADSIPMITGAYGSGDCLFLSGFRPGDWQDGTSLTWVVIDVRAPALLRVIRLRPPPEGSLPDFPEFSQFGAAVRDFDRGFAFTFRRMADGAAAVERFPLPDRCGQ
jgi:hypothetical protein